MKKILALLLIASCQLSAVNLFAQTIYICKDGDYTKQNITEGLSIDLSNLPDSITFTEPQIPRVVNVVYNGTTATVSIPYFMSKEVICSSGTSSQVIIANTDTLHEITYNISGRSGAGSLTISADYKMTVNLNNVTLTSSIGEAMRFKCGKRIALIMADGSTNTFADTNDNGATPTENDNHKACIYTKGHLEISGAGTLNVTGNYNHAISCKEYMKVKKDVNAINILGAKGDALHIGQYLEYSGGTLTIDANTLGDGIQVDYKTDDNDVIIPLSEDEENTSDINISGGTINVTLSATQDTKCIKAEGDINISGGTLLINANSRGSRAIQADGNVTISQAEGATTSITLYATAGKCNIEEHDEDPHKSAGIKLDGDFTISGGTLNVTPSGSSANGVRVAGNYIAAGGTTTISAKGISSDGINVDGNITFKSGSVTNVTNSGTNAKGIYYGGSITKESGATVIGSSKKKTTN